MLKKKLVFALLALISYVSAVSLFSEVLESVHEGNTLKLDEHILLTINHYSSPAMDDFFIVFTQLGGFIFLATITSLISVIYIARRQYYRSLFVVLSIGGAALINVGAKLFVGRKRPELWDYLVYETSNSFPSGHAMGSSALVFTILALLWKHKLRWLVCFTGTIYIGIIGYSRLYLGVHYPTDVIGGWLASFTWILTVATLIFGYEWKRGLKAPKPQG